MFKEWLTSTSIKEANQFIRPLANMAEKKEGNCCVTMEIVLHTERSLFA